jgi:hypothetical protein
MELGWQNPIGPSSLASVRRPSLSVAVIEASPATLCGAVPRLCDEARSSPERGVDGAFAFGGSHEGPGSQTRKSVGVG